MHDLKTNITNSSNSYFDTDFQVGEYDSNTIWAMVKKNLTTWDVNSFKTSLTLSKHFSFQTWDLWQAEQYFWMLPSTWKRQQANCFTAFAKTLRSLLGEDVISKETTKHLQIKLLLIFTSLQQENWSAVYQNILHQRKPSKANKMLTARIMTASHKFPLTLKTPIPRNH